MRRKILACVIMAAALLSLVSGCADTKTPKGAILNFFKVIKGGDKNEIAGCLSFDRLLLESMGEAYMGLPPEEKASRIADMREKMVASVTEGKLAFLNDFDPKVEKLDVIGDEARALVYNNKNKQEKMVFFLVREEGAWKIFSISANQPA